jgi:hypothetical protein
MNVNDFFPSAYHATTSEKLDCVFASRGCVVGSSKIRVVVARNVIFRHAQTVPEPCSVTARFAAILSFARSVRFDIEHVSAVLAYRLNALACAQAWDILNGSRPGLIGACSRAIVVVECSFRRLAVKRLSALRTRNVGQLALLPLCSAKTRAIHAV